jgi:hemoglobin
MPSVYDEIGGGDAVAAAVDDLYARLLDDPELAPYFTGKDMRKHTAHVRAFIAAALGGPKLYGGLDMRAAHAHARITGAHFERTVGHLVATLRSLGLAERSIAAVGERILPLREQIVAA